MKVTSVENLKRSQVLNLKVVIDKSISHQKQLKFTKDMI